MATEATIYLAEKRARTQSLTHRSFHCFNADSFHNANDSFYNLAAVNDETLIPSSHVEYSLVANNLIVLLPLIGKLEYKIGDKTGVADVGECIVLYGQRNSTLTLANTYEGEAINFVCTWFHHNERGEQYVITSCFDLDKTKNTLTSLCTAEHIKCHIGKFSGRKKVTLTSGNDTRGLFVFVLEGVFEVEDRLLHHKDGLAISTPAEAAFEALSNDAILLVFEI
jgi:hypothetical protein